MNAQEIFNKVATHLFKQGHRAINQFSYQCVYRAPNGDKCAVGALISDEDYRTALEGSPISKICRLLPEWFMTHMIILRDLQRLHDASWNWQSERDLKAALRGVAMNHELDHSILDGLSFEKNEPEPVREKLDNLLVA